MLRTEPAPSGSGLFERLAHRVAGAPRAILTLTALMLSVGGLLAIGAPGALSPAGYEVGNAESTRVAAEVAALFDAGAPNVAVLVTAPPGGSVDQPQALADGRRAAERLRAIADVREVSASWSELPALRSVDGSHALIAARIVADEDTTYDRVREIRSAMEDLSLDSHVAFTVGGSAAANLEMVEVSERDLLRAELIVFPITTIILLVVFRSVVAALLPLIVSLVAVIGTAVALRALSGTTLVSVFGLNLASALGVGMAVDYGLFLISRWREERPHAPDATAAMHVAMRTAGRSILFSGLTTAATLSALLIFDYPLLRSLALAGFIVVLLATFGALVPLPAAMYLLGDRIDSWQVRRPPSAKPIEEGRWYRLAVAIMRRPVLTIAATVAVLLIAGAPFLRADFGLPDDRVLPGSVESRQVADLVRTDFPDVPIASLAVLATDLDAEPDTIAASLSADRGVRVVETAEGVWAGGERVADAANPDRYLPVEPGADRRWFSVQTVAEPQSSEAADVVERIRALDVEGIGAEPLMVGGESARLVDNLDEIGDKLPLVLLWVAVVISVLLFVSFRSLLVPIKAFVLNLLSLTASFGAIVWIFQDGRFSDFLGYTPTGLTDAQTPVLMFCIAFGLSMDYEVFLLSRIREEWDLSRDPRRSVAVGLQRTGGIITAAGVLMAVVFLSFATGDVTFIQMVGIGLAIAILVDAFIVRTLLVPSFMALAGAWNWWLPGRSHSTSASGNSEEIDLRSPVEARSESPVPITNPGGLR